MVDCSYFDRQLVSLIKKWDFYLWNSKTIIFSYQCFPFSFVVDLWNFCHLRPKALLSDSYSAFSGALPFAVAETPFSWLLVEIQFSSWRLSWDDLQLCDWWPKWMIWNWMVCFWIMVSNAFGFVIGSWFSRHATKHLAMERCIYCICSSSMVFPYSYNCIFMLHYCHFGSFWLFDYCLICGFGWLRTKRVLAHFESSSFLSSWRIPGPNWCLGSDVVN